MKIGTKSVLFGVHCFLLHPFFVAWAWVKLFGWTGDPRIWISFFVHDLGYWGKPNMDGEEGERHVLLGAKIMHIFDGWERQYKTCFCPTDDKHDRMLKDGWKYKNKICMEDWRIWFYSRWKRKTTWSDFSKYHSRFYAKKDNKQYSRLCVADKLSFCLTPYWLYIVLATMSGEIYEYIKIANDKEGKYSGMGIDSENKHRWFRDVSAYMYKWVEEHKDLKVDYWTLK